MPTGEFINGFAAGVVVCGWLVFLVWLFRQPAPPKDPR